MNRISQLVLLTDCLLSFLVVAACARIEWDWCESAGWAIDIDQPGYTIQQTQSVSVELGVFCL